MNDLQEWCDSGEVLKNRMTRLMGELGAVNSLGKIQDYIVLLEERVVEVSEENEDLKKELSAVKHNRELTIKWAKGELEN